ncbi:Protein of unknown function [Pyronema omphalodes CBS 100304]|uniref:Uncharacterized protein n=1 Tax=Pyronema omphalodes (strain CBS 100304) TaxID=1076935 RepID=U4L0T7_PYROM|nr:Protein of unknown function [Pyronema omphalodes CBS 100304]
MHRSEVGKLERIHEHTGTYTTKPAPGSGYRSCTPKFLTGSGRLDA